MHRASLDGSVRFLGFVSDAELAWLYRNAALVVFLSLDEGFGIPVIEALALGSPILASDIEVFHEIAGNRAAYVDPTDVEAIGRSVRHALDKPPHSGVEPTSSAPSYTWDRSVELLRTLAVEAVGE